MRLSGHKPGSSRKDTMEQISKTRIAHPAKDLDGTPYWMTGIQRRYRFANGCTVSVIRNNFGSYGGNAGLFEAWDGGERGPEGYLTIMGLIAYLRDVRDRPTRGSHAE